MATLRCWGVWLNLRCPFGVPGGRLWGRERYYISNVDRGNPKVCIEYEDGTYILTAEHPLPTLNDRGEYDDGVKVPGYLCRWRAACFMPRWASRLDLDITSVAVGRVGDVTVAEARAEGTDTLCIDCNGTGKEQMPCGPDDTVCEFCNGQGEYPHEFRKDWDSRWPKYPFAGNPWAWTLGHELSKPGVGVGEV